MADDNRKEYIRELSKAMADAVDAGAKSTVTVAGRRGYPASGVVFDKEHVLTADHVVDQDEDITVVFPDGGETKAVVAGRDSSNDLALLKLEKQVGGKFDAAESTASVPEPRVGELVLALARPTDDGIQASLGVVGIVGGNYRMWRGASVEGVIRTDATRFPGFAGGPLVDDQGQILGVNVLGHRFGSSLTIPIEKARKIARTLAKEGTISKGYLGIRSQIVELPDNVSLGREQDTGLLIVGVEKGSPSDEAGILVGDIVVEFNSQPIGEHEALLSQLTPDSVGLKTSIRIVRAGKLETRDIEVGAAKAQRRRKGRRR